jgi:menaquinol-cytochrome c reductase iron-sulfur subunit
MSKSPNMNRREFVTLVTTAIGSIMTAIVGIPAIGYVLSPALKAKKTDAWIPLGKLENYPVNQPTLFTFTRAKTNGWEKTVNSFGVFVVRKSDTEIEILSNVCTHLSCRVNWNTQKQEYICPCHDGHFNIDGIVDSGPPPRPLDQYEYKIEDGNLFIHLKES